jgi:hypothetical protein
MKQLLIVCIGVSLLYSCKKEVKQNDNYAINGIQEITFGEQMSDTLSFSVDLIPGGKQEIVDLSIEGLPDDLSATFSKVSGTPSFTSILTIKRNESSTGTYYANLIGVSASGDRKAYPVKVVVPLPRDISFDRKYYKISSAINFFETRTIYLFSDQEARLGIFLPKRLPKIAGTYEYRVTPGSPDTGEGQLIFWHGDDRFLPGSRGINKITLDLDSNGTITKAYLPEIELTTNTIPFVYKKLSVNYNK